jgi:hypothetical protein
MGTIGIVLGWMGIWANADQTATFGSDMGTLTDGTPVGKKLMRGAWNARPYGSLYQEQVRGVANGTDFYFHKSTYMCYVLGQGLVVLTCLLPLDSESKTSTTGPLARDCTNDRRDGGRES